MSVVLRVGAVHTDFAKDGVCTDIDSYDDGSAPEDYSRPPPHYFPGCFGLPYQDHNYGAPRPPTPPPKVPSPLEYVDKINGHIEIEEVSISSNGPQATVDVTSDNIDDSVTRCICDFTHDDGYMICCDKCSVWQHIDCMAVDRANIPENYFCEICEPRPMDVDRARQIQIRKREFILGADSSTDTDPEEPANRRMSQDMDKKCKTKRRTKTLKSSKDEKGKRIKTLRKEVKKEKENKDTNKKLRISLKESFRKNMKNKPSKKPGLLSMVLNENAQQDPWDSSHSPWVDKYEEAKENQYSSDMQAILGLKKLNGSLSSSGNYNYNRNGRILVQLCHVTEVNKNRKGLEASETIGEGEAIIEYTGHVMLREQFNKDNFYKRLNPFVLFNSMFDNIELCIDATSYGNIARFIRRSCKSNAEVKHTFEDGELTFIVVATKVIPRGSEITIPYDYNYKECTYCVECACLRNNCPVAKYFKRKQNAQNSRKEKVMNKRSLRRGKSPSKNGKNNVRLLNQHPKSPKSPASSLPHSPVKSPIRRSISVEEPPIKEEEIEPEVPPPLPPPPILSPVKEERAAEVKEEAPVDHNTDSGTDHPDTHSESEENPSSERTRRMSREDRKMEAIMKAFEKMEKRQERRKEALARIEGSKKPTSSKTEEVKKEKEKVKVHQEPKESKKGNDCNSSSTEEEKKEVEKIKPEKTNPELKVTTPAQPSPVKKENKVSHKKRKRSSSKRKTRAQSTNMVKSEPQSQDEGSNAVPSCPSTPVSAPPDVHNTPPSFKFLKTKKHLMNEWLSEKNQDPAPLPPPHPSKVEPLEVQVDEVMYVACKPSPRNALDHLRRNSASAGSSPCASLASLNKQSGENSIGSAKKRWLRQAMFDKPVPGALSRPMSPLRLAGGSSPNPHVSLPSPGGSPPGDYITPLKKRRLASYRESLDQPYPGTSDIGSSAAEDQSDEALDVSNSDHVSSGARVDHVEDQPGSVNSAKQETDNASSSVRNTEESDTEQNVDNIVLRTESTTCDTGSSCVTSHTDSVIQSSNECDSRQEINSLEEDNVDTCDFSSRKSDVMEVDSTQSDSCREGDKKEALCDSTCKVEDNQACSSSQSVAEQSLVDSSSDVNSSDKSNEVVQVTADSNVDKVSSDRDCLSLENVCSSSDRSVHNFDVSSSSELNHVESSQVTDSVNVSSSEQTSSLYSATSESGVADSSMSDRRTDFSDICVSDVSGTGDPVHYVHNISATDSVGEPVASSSIHEDSGVLSEPSTPQESHPPTKKKVSLLEYRKRLKEKTTVSTPSSKKSSVSSAAATPSTTSTVHRHHRLSTLPSLPLFDSSPTKDNSSRYQFRSSSDLIRRKSADGAKEKRPQLSLSERLRMEFGLDDSEEEKDTEKEVASAPVTSSVQPAPVFQHPPVLLRVPTPGVTPNGPSTGPVPSVTNVNGGIAGPMSSSPVLSSKGPASLLLPNGNPSPGLLPTNGNPTPGLLPTNGNPTQGLLPTNGNPSPGLLPTNVGKSIPSLLSIKTYPTRNLPNGMDTGSTPPSAVDQANMFQANGQDVPANQPYVNHINQPPVGTTSQPPFYPSSNGTQQTFNGTNRTPNGSIVCDYNHGFNNTEQSAPKHYHTQDQRKKSNKFKRKHYNNYQDSGGGHYH